MCLHTRSYIPMIMMQQQLVLVIEIFEISAHAPDVNFCIHMDASTAALFAIAQQDY